MPPRRQISAPGTPLDTGGCGAPSARPAVFALGSTYYRNPHHLSSCCRVQTSSGPLLGSLSPQGSWSMSTGLSSSLLSTWGPVLAQASLLALYFQQCNTLGCSLLRCRCCRQPSSRPNLDVVGAIYRTTIDPRGQRQHHFEAFSGGDVRASTENVEIPSTHHPNLSKKCKNNSVSHSIGVA